MPSEEYKKLVSIEHLFSAWKKFSKGKLKRSDISAFWINLEDNIFNLYDELTNLSYIPREYSSFVVTDPKRRIIHKAEVRDRIVHEIVFEYLNTIFDKSFIFHSYSSRVEKGTHRAVIHSQKFCQKIYKTHKYSCFGLKCDIKSFFDSVDHKILFELIKRKVKDTYILSLVWLIISHFEKKPNKGIPLGNMTSQIFANIYMNELDFYMKNVLKTKYYLRFNDDFIIFHHDRNYLQELITIIRDFLDKNLQLMLPDSKLSIRSLRQGIDFLGMVILPYGLVHRTKSKKRMMTKININNKSWLNNQISYTKYMNSINSYLGMIKISNSYNLRKTIISDIRRNFIYLEQ